MKMLAVQRKRSRVVKDPCGAQRYPCARTPVPTFRRTGDRSDHQRVRNAPKLVRTKEPRRRTTRQTYRRQLTTRATRNGDTNHVQHIHRLQRTNQRSVRSAASSRHQDQQTRADLAQQQSVRLRRLRTRTPRVRPSRRQRSQQAHADTTN